MKSKENSGVQRVAIHSRVYPYVETVIQEAAAKENRTFSNMVESILTEYAGRRAKANGKQPAKKVRNGK